MSLRSPVESADPVPLQPRFPSHCRVLASELDCRGTPSTGQGLRGGLLAVEMADSSDDQRTLELIYVITWLDGEHESGLLRPLPGEDRCQLAPRQPAALLPGSTWTTSLRYLRLGVEHILAPLAGADHLLFVLGLILLVGDLRTLLWCITAFTLGHSLTLAAATLDLLRLPGPPVEILIALSIVFLARELAQSVTFPADLANPKARRSHGGSAALTTEFIKKYPAETKKYIAAYARGIELVRSKPDEARQYLKGYTAIEGPLTGEVPLASYMLYNEFKPADIAAFQKFFDLFTEKGVFEKKLAVDSLIYKG